jgi:glyceraldehyde 3-phosphate dehydrogenase
MPVKCAVNGFGRIGRLTFKYIWDTDPSLEIVHVNDLCSCESAAYLLKYDSVHGTWDKDVETEGETAIVINGDKKVSFSSEKDFTKIDFQALGVELVLECTGKFLSTDVLQPYLDVCKVKQVVVSAPVKEKNVLNVVLGCNHKKLYDQHYPIITNASCTTNCLAPVVKVIQESYGIVHGCITTIHVSVIIL